jgi:hypothetical protein
MPMLPQHRLHSLFYNFLITHINTYNSLLNHFLLKYIKSLHTHTHIKYHSTMLFGGASSLVEIESKWEQDVYVCYLLWS